MSGSPFGALRQQLLDATGALADGPDAVAGILSGMVDDVDQALGEELEIFPVCHHSPASALAMVRRLREKQPKVIYLELCEDLAPLLAELRNCRLPVALQAFASELDGFPREWGPLSVVAPITEASAEYQAIAYALDTPGVELVLVDRSTDHVFQWEPRDGHAGAENAGPEDAGSEDAGPEDADPEQVGTEHAGTPENEPETGAASGNAGEDAALHGDAVGIELGDLRPRFAELETYLLEHGKVRHWSEWWDQYVEQPLLGADYDTYRQVMVLIGSLFRRLAPDGGSARATARAARRLAQDEDRERYMWTRMREHVAATGTEVSQCLYVCGAFHAASRVEQFGVGSTAPLFDITPRTATRWLYGLIPSSHSAIEAQFGLATGSVSIAAATWAKALGRGGTVPFQLEGQKGTRKRTARVKPVAPVPRAPSRPVRPGASDSTRRPGPVADRLSGFLGSAPEPGGLDEDELLGWCVDIVRLARRNGYLASTADAVAVYETSILLAGLRNRARPTPYDFQDAAVTCIEKDVVPGRRDVRRLCEVLLGGDRIGQVGYDALPPLARDVYDRLAPLGLDLEKRTVQRALMDLNANPELEPCSRLLWMLRYLLPDDAVRPIMGERRLGERSIQESWDLAIGRHQRPIIELGYEGVTVERVLEQRLRRTVWGPDATAAVALSAVEDAVLYLGGRRFTDELGARAVELLAAERTVDDAPEVLRRIRRLLAHYRATEPALPAWCEAFVTAGYAHYCTLLPTAFVDEETGVRQVAAMLGFLLTMESLALSLGCDRAQLELAVLQSHPEAPAKVALLWAARFQLGLLALADLRSRCDELLANPLVVPAFPQYLSGFVQALEPAPALAPFVVEIMSNAFARLPDPVLLPWLPTLITTLRDQAHELVPVLIREAGRTFPASLPAVDSWVPPWRGRTARGGESRGGTAGGGIAGGGITGDGEAGGSGAVPAGAGGAVPPRVPVGPVAALLAGNPATCDAVAELLGCGGGWQAAATDETAVAGATLSGAIASRGVASGEAIAARELLVRHPDTAVAVAELLVRSGG